MSEGFGCVTPERWKKLVDHVQQKVEDHYWEHDGLYETMIDPFIIHMEDSSDGSSSSGKIPVQKILFRKESDAFLRFFF